MKRSETPQRSGVGRAPENDRASQAAVRAFVHDVVNPIAAIRLSLGALRARGALTEREMVDIHRIEEAAGTIVHLVSNLAPTSRDGGRAPPGAAAGPAAAPTSGAGTSTDGTPAVGTPVAGKSVDLYVLCCELAATRRVTDGSVIYCRAFGDPRGGWDREQIASLVSRLLDLAIARLGAGAPLTIAVTGMTRHVRLDIQGVGGERPVERRPAARDVTSRIGPSPPGTTVSAIAAPSGGIVFRLRLPRQILRARTPSAGSHRRFEKR